MNGEDGQSIRIDLKYQKTDLFVCFVEAYKQEPSLEWVSAIPVKQLARFEERGCESDDFDRDIFGMCLHLQRAI